MVLGMDGPRLVGVLGAPGSGKGEVIKVLTRCLGRALMVYPASALLAEEARQNTPRGKVISLAMQDNKLVSDTITNEVMGERVPWLKCVNEAVVLCTDGYPRTVSQMGFHEQVGIQVGHLPHVLYVETSDDVIIGRLGNRLQCPKCNMTYNTLSSPPQRAGVCNECESTLVRRQSDEGDVRERLELFREALMPVRNYFAAQRRLTVINGDQPLQQMQEEVVAAVTALYPLSRPAATSTIMASR